MTKTLSEFVDTYGDEIRMYKEYDNGVVMFKFENPGRIMWLKQRVCEELGMDVKASMVGRTYWFE